MALGKRQSPGHTAPQPAQHSKISDGPYWAKSVWAVMKHITNSQWMQIGLTYWSVTPGSRTKLRSNAERLQITITPAIHNWNITDSAVSRFVKNNFKYCSLLLHLLILWFYWYANFWWTELINVIFWNEIQGCDCIQKLTLHSYSTRRQHFPRRAISIKCLTEGSWRWFMSPVLGNTVIGEVLSVQVTQESGSSILRVA